MWKDYDLENPGSWTVMEAPTVDRSWEEALTRIGGLNRFGKPNLVWRWGATYRDPMAEDNGLKYWLSNREPTLEGFVFTDPVTSMELMVKNLDDVPSSILVAVPKYTDVIELGQRRIIIEQWRSPEFLAQSGRYHATMLREPDRTREFYFCKACNEPLLFHSDGPQAGPQPCGACGSTRHYVSEFRQQGEGQLLRTFPTEGCYDCFLILENANGEPMEPDGNALQHIEHYWHETQTRTLRDKIIDTLAEAENQEELRRVAAENPSNPFTAPAIPGA